MTIFDEMWSSDRTLHRLMREHQASNPLEAIAFDLDHWRRIARDHAEVILLPFVNFWDRFPAYKHARIKPMIDDNFRKMMSKDARTRRVILVAARLDNPFYVNELTLRGQRLNQFRTKVLQ